MEHYDVFNGDADGICALVQWRLARPAASRLVTGVKRDITLLKKVFPEPGDSVTVMDVSLDSNREDLNRILAAGAAVTYFDHHFAGEVPAHPLLEPHLSRSADTCTSLLVDDSLQGQYREWALVGAFGDNLDGPARRLGSGSLSEGDLDRLRELGRLLNYNGYGRTVEDLHVPPDRLYRMAQAHRSPFDFLAAGGEWRALERGLEEDLARAGDIALAMETDRLSVCVLPDEAWARRVSGVLANDLSRRRPEASHAVLVPNGAACYLVSVRVAEGCAVRADEFCLRFPSGGGRAAAGGINHLPARRLPDFLKAFRDAFA